MTASKLYYEALRCLPERFIDDETRSTQCDEDAIIAANPKYPPMVYKRQTRKWIEISYEKVGK